MRHAVFVNGVNVYDGLDEGECRVVVEIAGKFFRATLAHGSVEVIHGPDRETHTYRNGGLVSENSLDLSAWEHLGIKDRVM